MEARPAHGRGARLNQGLTAFLLGHAAMYKAVFQNSKVALLFAGMTILSAVSMVGTSEDSGVVGRVTGFVEANSDRLASSGSEAQNGGGEGESAAAEPSVFGDYTPASQPAAAAPAAASAPGGNPMTAPLSSTARIDNSQPSFTGSGEEIASEAE
jgi:hypothetical protein